MNIQNSQSQIPFKHFGGEGQLLHFAHANGFPPGVYVPFLDHFKDHFEVKAIQHRPLWQEEPDRSVNWITLSDDLIHFLDQQGAKKIIGMGHSMGGVATMFAAVKRPDLFDKIVLIEPVFVLTRFAFWFYLLPKSIQHKMNPMIKGALRRKDHWKTQEEVYNSWREKRVFRRISDEGMKHLVEASIKSDGNGGLTLAFSKYWEAHFYGLLPKVWKKLAELNIPIMGIRGEKSNTISPGAWEKWQKIQPDGNYLELEGYGHLIPLEAPEQLANEILNFIK